jgi:glycosyltransferase involved in cell wall biosynthesis
VKVNIDAQIVCSSKLRGTSYYTKSLINSLYRIKSKGFQYSVSYFDYKREKNNRQYIQRNLLDDCPGLQTYECNSYSYRDIYDCCTSDDFSELHDTYDDMIGFHPDIHHFPRSFAYPYKITKHVVVTVHDLIPLVFSEKHYWTENVRNQFYHTHQYLSHHDEIIIIADSECTKKDLIERLHVKENRIFVVPLGYDRELYYPQQNDVIIKELSIEKPYLLYLGALDMRKGVPDILKAFYIIKDQYKDVELVLAGKMDPIFQEEYGKRLEEINSKDVIFTGYVSDEQKRVLMSSAEAFLFPSEYEGFGLPVLEAMACGTPVITTNVSSLPEVGKDAVLYVSPGQPEELAAQMGRILDSTSLRREYSAKGLERSKQFSWENTAAMTENVYQIAYDIMH